MTDTSKPELPSDFIAEWIARLAPATPRQAAALDLASGSGRHLVVIARAGFIAYGVDRNLEALIRARRRLESEALHVRLWCADLTAAPLPARRFDLIVVTRYLQRDLFAALSSALAPDGVLLYETFTTRQLQYDRGPRSPDHLLQAGELAGAFPALETLFYEEVEEPEAVARLAARAAHSR